MILQSYIRSIDVCGNLVTNISVQQMHVAILGIAYLRGYQISILSLTQWGCSNVTSVKKTGSRSKSMRSGRSRSFLLKGFLPSYEQEMRLALLIQRKQALSPSSIGLIFYLEGSDMISSTSLQKRGQRTPSHWSKKYSSQPKVGDLPPPRPQKRWRNPLNQKQIKLWGFDIQFSFRIVSLWGRARSHTLLQESFHIKALII